MWGFFQNYGLWIVLGVIFLVMHRFGLGCCGGHDHRPDRGSGEEEDESELKSEGGGGLDRRR
ncbi:MAG: hypothetical protein C3F12_09095 [Candidatus Methylomirabilota bacterium]|nr:hypothetical protein [Candidatus Methylomirabilis sp.]NJD68911.1 hypothetical protein [candidate division NC10 bacterium]PWB46193.1 MAG: hypothetical protein C3F12_09095 [candidate division NC10 bacterium]